MFVPISTYLEIARISQFLAANDIADQSFLRGGSVNANLARLLYLVRKPIQWLFEHDPTNETLNAPTIYLYGLCGRYVAQAEQIIANQSAVAPVLTNPTNQSVTDGANASFSTVVTSVLPFTLQWYKDSVLIPGATSSTYSFTASIADTGSTYSVTATNAVGSVSSSSATLTVTDLIFGSLYIGQTDYYSQLLLGIDNINYTSGFQITHNQPIVVPLPFSASQNNYQVYKVPITESIKTSWSNGSFNNGSIPDAIMRTNIVIGSYRYYLTRVEIVCDINQPMTLS